MTLSHHVLLVIGAVCFGLGACGVSGLNWVAAGLCCVTLSWVVP